MQLCCFSPLFAMVLHLQDQHHCSSLLPCPALYCCPALQQPATCPPLQH